MGPFYGRMVSFRSLRSKFKWMRVVDAQTSNPTVVIEPPASLRNRFHGRLARVPKSRKSVPSIHNAGL